VGPLLEFLRLIEEENIAFAAYKIPLGGVTLLQVPTASNDEAYEKYKAQKDRIEKANISVVVLLDAASPKEIALKEMCFRELLELTKGEIIQLDKKEESAFLAQLLIGLGTFRESFRASGSFSVAAALDSSYDSCVKIAEHAEKKLLEHVEEGKIVFMPGEYWLTPQGGRWYHMEQAYSYDAADPESIKTCAEISSYINETMIKQKFGPWGDGYLSYDDFVHDSAGPKCLNYHLKIRAIKKALDPNLLSESSFYTTPRE
jgi:hypothetical protein